MESEKKRPRWDSNPQPHDPKSCALSIAPLGLSDNLSPAELLIDSAHTSPKSKNLRAISLQIEPFLDN